jgi:hypothetical protein
LRLGFHFRALEPAKDVVTEDYARTRQLRVDDLDKPQALAGIAYVRGMTLSSAANATLIDANFTPSMKRTWKAEENFRSLMCVPVLGTRQWVPIGVMYLTSTSTRPFWVGLDERDFGLLEQQLRSSFAWCLRYRTP